MIISFSFDIYILSSYISDTYFCSALECLNQRYVANSGAFLQSESEFINIDGLHIKNLLPDDIGLLKTYLKSENNIIRISNSLFENIVTKNSG